MRETWEGEMKIERPCDQTDRQTDGQSDFLSSWRSQKWSNIRIRIIHSIKHNDEYFSMLSRAYVVYFISICQASFMQDIDDQALPPPGQ